MTRRSPYFVPSMPPMSDRDIVNDALALFDRPEHELHQRVLDADVDVDAFIEGAFNATLPPI